MATVSATQVNELRNGFKGQLVLPGDGDYESARMIWNGMIDKRPALIARCAGTPDIVRVINFAREAKVVLAVRGGGHNIAGNALCDDGVVIDLSRMRGVRVDAGARRAHVEGGALLADFDAATQAHGLSTPVGINSTTGIAGLTLGGGFGWLSRKHGMTVDNLESVEVVTAAGQVVRASAKEHPDLFWALRGGSGNFGVASNFEFRLHPLGPNVLTGLIVYPFTEARSVLRQYDDFVANAPDDLTVWAVLRLAPPLPFLPAEVHGQRIVVLALFYAGDPGRGEALLAPLRRLGTVLGEHIGVQPYAAWQQTFDPLLAPGARNYWKSHNLSMLKDGFFDTVIAAIERLPSPECEIFFGGVGGATTRPAVDSTAYAHRDARYVMNVHGRWQDKADDVRCIAWARDFFKASAPYASGGVYVNFLTADEGDRVRNAYGPSYERLARVKRQYDSDNLFCMNQNIIPA